MNFCDIDVGFYSSLEKTYLAALTLMVKENLLDNFEDRAGKLVTETSDIGWGFHENLHDIYSDFFDR